MKTNDIIESIKETFKEYESTTDKLISIVCDDSDSGIESIVKRVHILYGVFEINHVRLTIIGNEVFSVDGKIALWIINDINKGLRK
ncbi:MAG: hypothetical protein QXN68_02680 [Thermoplasmata archaeon]